MAAARAADRANQNTGLDLMFAPRTAAVAARFQARMAMPYDAATMAQNILRPQNPNVPTNITPPDHIRLGWIVGPFQVRPDGTLPGAYGRSITHYCRMICEYVNRNNAPPRNLPGTIPVCGLMPGDFYPGNPWPPPPARTVAQWYPFAIGQLNALYTNPANFLQMRNVFFTILTRRYPPNPNAGSGHAFVIIVSPLARTVDYLDSGNWPPEQDIMGHFFGLLSRYLGRGFNPRDWRMRFDGSIKQAPGSTDCGIHTTANMMSIAFGNYLNHIGRNILRRRERFVSEAWNGKFDNAGDYSYPLNYRGPDRLSTRRNGVPPARRVTRRACVQYLDAAGRGRFYANGAYDGMNKIQLSAHCRTNRALYWGLISWGRPRNRSVADYRERVEIRDLQGR